jgi:hypothetical protein
MPATTEALLVLIFFVAPGFISTQVKNKFVPFRVPSAFAETVESVILSCLHIPFWAWLLPILLPLRARVAAAWTSGTTLHPYELLPSALYLLGLYLIISPIIGWVYAGLLRRLGTYGPEVWDKVFFGRLEQPWVRVRLVDGKIYQGVAAEISVSPSERELFLTAPSTPRTPGQNPRLALYDANGALIEDLEGSGAQGVWLTINDQVRSVEVFS